MQFWKLHGLGNDFIALDGRDCAGKDYTELAKTLCHRRTGIGADGLIVAENSSTADIRMRIINSDGSEAEMCGNGIRCFAKYLYESGILQKQTMEIETLGGRMRPVLTIENGLVTLVRVEMGMPLFDCSEIPAVGSGTCIEKTITVLGQEWTVTSLRIGVPHTMLFVENLDAVDIASIGPAIEHADLFPERTNVNFVQPIDENTVRLATWERGCGQTLCCGTGSASTAVAACLVGKTGRKVEVQVALGSLFIDWAEDGSVSMTGPAEVICKGDF